MTTPIVVVCIAKNEAKTLPRLHASIQGLADRWCVVDTGSEDDTVAVARSLGAETFRIQWKNDFAWARNMAVKLACGEDDCWVLNLDCDEVVRNPQQLREELLGLGEEIKGVVVRHETGMGHVFHKARFWRNGYGAWKYRAHNMLVVRGKTVASKVTVLEHPDAIGTTHPTEPYLAALRMDAHELPYDANRQYYYGRQLFYRGDEAALRYLERCAMLSHVAEEAAMALTFAGLLSVRLGNPGKAMEYYRTAITRCPVLRDPLVRLMELSQNPKERAVLATMAKRASDRFWFDSDPGLWSPECQEWIEAMWGYEGNPPETPCQETRCTTPSSPPPSTASEPGGLSLSGPLVGSLALMGECREPSAGSPECGG